MSKRELTMPPLVIIQVDSANAFLPLAKSSILKVAIGRALSAICKPEILIQVAPALADQYQKLDRKQKPEQPVVFSDDLYQVLRDYKDKYQVVLVHEATRPLTPTSVFDQVCSEILAGVDAARPAHVVVDTLHRINNNRSLTGTIDRNTVQALTSPEGYWLANTQLQPSLDGWSCSVHDVSNRKLVPGDLESIKVRNPEDVVLVESFLEWEKLNPVKAI
jgi:2-C-methyl-D-erythritol 4-phosphate cytidylyltransferase